MSADLSHSSPFPADSTKSRFRSIFIACLSLISVGEAHTAADADAAFDAFNNAFLSSTSATNAIYRKTAGTGTADFWTNAEEIEMALDVYERTHSANHKATVIALLAGFSTAHGTNWSSNDYNDDLFWATMAYTRAYQLIGDANYLSIAKANFDLTYARGWDTVQGGMFWRTAKDSKNSCVNGPGAIAAYLLYQATSDSGYLAKSTAIYNWERSVLFESATGGVYDNITTSGTISKVVLTYNSGTFIGAANFLGQTADAKLAADYVKRNIAGYGILPQYGEGSDLSGFNGIFLRWMARFMKDRQLQPDYLAWLQLNADAGWKMRRPVDNVSWCQWGQITPAGDRDSWSCSPTVVALQVVPPDGQGANEVTMPAWFPANLTTWSAASDPSAPYCRSSVPLASRFVNTATTVNAQARTGEGHIAMLASLTPATGGPAQGSMKESFPALSYWQYADQLVCLGGSATQGIIVPPNPAVVDAAHRNGVAVLGSIQIPGATDGGKAQLLSDLLTMSGSSYPVADKLIEVANYMGFDGWYLNVQLADSSTTSSRIRNLIAYVRANSTLKILWQDAMVETGGISPQNALTASNDWFVSNSGLPVAYGMVLNPWWTATTLASSRSRAQALALDPYTLFADVNLTSAGYGTTVNWAAPFPAGLPQVTSLSLRGMQWLYQSSSSPADFAARENRLWSGANGDPSNTATTDAWLGIANYVPAASSIDHKPFVTNFNRGQGQLYAVSGSTVATREWNNLSLQDILPTWRWMVQSTGSKLQPSLDLTDAFEGGSSLYVTGTLDAVNDLRLYSTKLDVTAQTKLRIRFKTGTANAASSMKVAVAFADAPASFVYYDVGNTSSQGWNTALLDLGGQAGRTIAVIGLRFQSATTISSYAMRVGQIAVYDGDVSIPLPPSGAVTDAVESIDPDTVNARIRWQAPTTGAAFYNVWLRNPDNSRAWLATTASTACYVPLIRRQNLETTLNLEIESVAADSGRSASITRLAVPMPPGPYLGTRLTGTTMGTPGSHANSGNTFDKVFDQIFSTFFDSDTATGAWAGLDLGANRHYIITAIRYSPRPGLASRIVGGYFQGANTADFSDAVTIGAVTSTPIDWIFTTMAVSNSTGFRYVRYVSPTFGYGNISELEFYGQEMPMAPAGLAGAVQGNAVQLSWQAVSNASSYTVKRADSAAGPFVTVASGLTVPAWTDSSPFSGSGSFIVSATNAVGTSPDSAPVTVIDAYLSWLSQNGWNAGNPGTGFAEDLNANGLSNGIEYMVPAGLQIASAGLTADIRNDSAVTITLELSPDLLTWVAVEFPAAADQTGVATGFTRLTLAASGDGSAGGKFYRLRFEK